MRMKRTFPVIAELDPAIHRFASSRELFRCTFYSVMPCTDDASGDTGDRRSSFGCAASAAVQPSLSVKTTRSWRDIVAFTHLAREGRMTVTIGRRELLAALGGAAAAWPVGARAQQPERMRRIGVLTAFAEDDPEIRTRLAAFRQGLEKRGCMEALSLFLSRPPRKSPSSLQSRAILFAAALSRVCRALAAMSRVHRFSKLKLPASGWTYCVM